MADLTGGGVQLGVDRGDDAVDLGERSLESTAGLGQASGVDPAGEVLSRSDLGLTPVERVEDLLDGGPAVFYHRRDRL